MCSAAWGDDIVVPTPVYFNDFSFATSGSDGIEIVGNGQFEDDADARFGKIFHNDPSNTSAVRTNYLKLPTDVLSHSATSKEMTIGFWVNKKGENDFWFMPLFTAYGAAPASNVNTFPMFACQARGLLQVNCAGWCNFDNTDNDNSTNYEGTYWLDDGAWHYYSVALTETTAKVYVDGSIVNSWTVNKSDGHNISGLFTNGSELTYVCLGGNQSWDWDNADPAFGFDDFAVYNVALTKAQIDQIRANKLNRTVTGTKVGNQDNSTEYLTATSDKVTLYPGDSYHYRFINYNKGSNNHNNWMLPVYNSSDENVIAVRADNWEDKHHEGETWGSSAGCTSNFNWTNFPGNMNGAIVDMTVTFTTNKKFTMSSTINTVNGSEWSYSYTNDYTGSTINLTSNNFIKVALSVSRSWIDILSSGFSVQMGTNGYATYASPYPLDLTTLPSGLTAYKATIDGSIVRFTAISQKVAPNNGFLLKGTPSQAYTIPVTNSGSIIADNAFMVNASGNTFDGPGYTHYGMIKDSNPLKFGVFNPDEVAIPGNKAYLRVATSSTARELTAIFDDDETTGVTSIDNGQVTIDNAWYNLNGQKVLTPTKGLYIVNGKKVIIK